MIISFLKARNLNGSPLMTGGPRSLPPEVCRGWYTRSLSPGNDSEEGKGGGAGTAAAVVDIEATVIGVTAMVRT